MENFRRYNTKNLEHFEVSHNWVKTKKVVLQVTGKRNFSPGMTTTPSRLEPPE